MSSSLVERAIDVLNDARELGGVERDAFLVRACVGDPALLAEVRSLLASEERMPQSGFLDASRSCDDCADAYGIDRADAAALIGERVGAYTIIDVLGEGGMGIVFRAEQESPHRTVALKLVRPGFMGRRARHRFAHESEVLGRLQHPGIAQIYEAGTAETRRGTFPFFAMELIDGLPLTEHADARRLDTRERLRLMATVCDAVQHAHQNGVIHRDLKPGNILVDETGCPKILDFGVARAVDSDVVATTMRTHIGELVGTLHYMSPEQCTGDPAKIDTRSDIYTLGVICRQLLSGKMPYDVRNLPFPEIIRIIREEEPSALRTVSGAFRGDIETIIAKAMAKDPERRYPSAASLASDLRRYLRHEPIAARPPSAMYQLRRFARRNRALVAGIAAVFVVLVAGIVATSWQAAWATRGWKTAGFHQSFRELGGQTRTAVITAILRADPGDEEAFARVVADLSEVRLETFGPMAHELVADVYGRIGEFDLAETHLRRALELHREGWGETHGNTLRSINTLGDLLRRAGRLKDASALMRETFDLCGYVPGTEDQYVEDELGCWLALRLTHLGNTLAETLRDQGRLIEADAMLEKLHDGAMLALTRLHELRPEVHGQLDLRRNALVLTIRESRGELFLARGDVARAESVFRDLLAVDHDMESRDALVTGTLEILLGETLIARSQWDEAERLIQNAGARLRAEFGPESPDALLAAAALARLRLTAGRLAEAESLLSVAVEAADRRYPDHWRTAVLRGDLGVVRMRRGRRDAAAPALASAIDRLATLFAENDYRVRRLREAE